MSEQDDDMKPHWTLDRRVPIAVIAALLIQTVGIGIWVGSLTTRVSSLEQALQGQGRYDARISVLETQSINVNQNFLIMRDQLDKLDSKMDRLLSARMR